MAIGTGDFTAKQKKGFVWKFGVGDTWEEIEPKLIKHLKQLGREWNKQRSLATGNFQEGMVLILDKLKDDPETMDSVISLLGLTLPEPPVEPPVEPVE